ncbi:hypothetical protein N0V83_003480 [Neocucurbitaria cava]|uniref:DOC domain-containing protein n=1 Tax=Neocucurbitaria cava TaxID=798079 RepID=A0A9W9CPG9_9PLEO|nr:hypothetical protein N0V83_003480 [Neocucurbitaria cava]
MPPSLRRRAQQQHHLPPRDDSDDTDSDIEISRITGRRGMEPEDEEGETMGEEMVALEGEDELEDEEDALASPHQSNTPLPNLDPPPSYLREISTLASWTVSSSKPGCSIPQLRHPSTSLFWQSDGPQPHYLNIHFFKLVRIVGLRLYLDFEQDESYTPTRIIFLAGSGMNDLQEWGEMRLESPRGWVWADFSGVGDPDSDDEEDDGEDDDDDRGEEQRTLGAPSLATGGLPGGADNASSDSENNAPRPRLIQAPSDETMHLDPHMQTPTLNHPHHPDLHQTLAAAAAAAVAAVATAQTPTASSSKTPQRPPSPAPPHASFAALSPTPFRHRTTTDTPRLPLGAPKCPS